MGFYSGLLHGALTWGCYMGLLTGPHAGLR